MRSQRWLVVACVIAAAPVRAEKLAVGPIHGEADVSDEAAAVGMLARSALARGADRTAIDAPANITIGKAAEALGKVSADHVVLGELSREGTGLRVTIAIVGSDGSRDISYVRAGDGDVKTLAQGVVDRVSTKLNLAVNPVAEAPLGALRPFVTAQQLAASDAQAAAIALTDADRLVVVGVPAAAAQLGALPDAVPLPLGVLAARKIGDVKRLEALGANPDPKQASATLAARAFAALGTDPGAAEALVAKPPKDGLAKFARAVIAEARGNDAVLRQAIKEGLAGDQARAFLALASTVLYSRLPPELHKALVAAAEKNAASPGVASRIGLNAALAGVELPRALALISVRELGDYDLKQLEPLIAKADEVTVLRLKSELAMRQAKGGEAVAIAAFLAAAPDDTRAHRYQGWQLMAEHKYKEAAEEFAKAGARGERARALMATGDPAAALAALEHAPETPEELVYATRAALMNKRLDEAMALIERAERGAPSSAVVHAAIIDVLANKPDAARLAVSRIVIEKGAQAPPAGSMAGRPSTGVIAIAPEAGSGSGAGSAGSATTTSLIKLGFDPAMLDDGLVGSLSALRELPHRTLVLAEIRWKPGLLSFREINSKPVQDALLALLARPPYQLEVRSEPNPLPDRALDRTTLAKLTEQSDAVLIFRVAPVGKEAHISLMLYEKSATEAQVGKQVPIPGVIVWNTGKLTLVGVVVGLIALSGLVWLLRPRGLVIVDIPRAPEIDDEVLCIEISKSSTRPKLGSDPATFHVATRKAGVITKRRFATLIASGAKFVVPAGHWYVHLYGTLNRGSRIQEVPPWLSKEIDVSRGDDLRIEFDLSSKLAEVEIEVVADPPRGIVVWANDQEANKVYTDADGKARLHLPVGTHEIHINTADHVITKPLQILAVKLQRLSVNVERERRVASGVEVDLDVKGLELDVAESPVAKPKSNKIAIDANTGDKKPLASAPTQFEPSMSQPANQPRAATPVPGDTLLDRYKIVAELGRGAMGVVHRAWDEKLERAVAIKEMADDLRANPEAMRLFTQEAKALAQLNHTNIVAMYDQVTDASGVYMIMEFVDGHTLEAIIAERGALPWREAIGIADQALDGLAYAHARKVIHRDIKPANIFVATDRTVKLGDFGLARVMREVTIKRTEIRGTPLYMAPEQILGTDVDHRVDLYAIGCTLFELVCGRPPFVDGDILYAQLQSQAPSPSSLVAGLPPALEEVILSLLAKQADDRPGSANEVRATLRGLMGQA